MEQADKIIERAEKIDDSFPDSQSQHIRTNLNNVKNAKSDFETYFANEKEFQALTEEQRQQIKPTKEQEFINGRKIRAKVEILADYTALYLQSDGSIEDFVMTCLKKTDQEALKSYLGENFDKVKLSNLNRISRRETKLAKMNELGEKFPTLINTYLAFYNEIKRTLTSSKGKFAETNEEDEDLDLLGEYYGGGFMDGPAGFSSEGQSEYGGGGDSLWSEIGALVKAMAEEVPNVK